MSEAPTLPQMRQDLRIFKAAPLATGAPGWVVLDPVRNRYFQIGRSVLDILNAWSAGSIEAIRHRVAARSGKEVSAEEIIGVLRFLEGQELVEEPTGGSQRLTQKALQGRHFWLIWLVHNYLFIRLPLLRPQKFLNATRIIGDVVFSRAMLGLFAVLGAIALALVARRWDVFLATAASFLTIDSFFAYGASLLLVKSIHELGHAYMATRYGVRVPSMGVAFMVLAPFLYSDVSDAWRLTSRRKRLAIGAAGILAELMLAVLALFAWVFLPDGPLRAAAFVTATTSLVATLLLNLNPFMRFDGYHLLADAVGIPNLQTRAMAVGRWRLREFLWGLKAPPPDHFEPGVRRILALYAYAIWIYRFFLFAGIAVLVYHMAFKVLGVVLFLIEVVWFILRPIFMELNAQWQGRSEIMRRPRTFVTLAVFFSAVVALFLPLSSRVEMPAMAVAAGDAPLYPAAAGRIERIERREGEAVRAGDVILVLQSPDLETELRRSRLRLVLLEQRLARIAADHNERTEMTVLAGQREAELSKLASLQKQSAELVLRAPRDGVLREVDPALRAGLWIGLRTLVGRVVDAPGGEVRGYVEEADLRRIEDGATGAFIPDDPLTASFPVKLATVGRTAVEDVDLLALASTNDGPVPVTEDGRRKLKPGVSIYPVKFAAEPQADIATSLRGHVFLQATPESFAARAARRIVGVLIRESGV